MHRLDVWGSRQNCLFYSTGFYAERTEEESRTFSFVSPVAAHERFSTVHILRQPEAVELYRCTTQPHHILSDCFSGLCNQHKLRRQRAMLENNEVNEDNLTGYCMFRLYNIHH